MTDLERMRRDFADAALAEEWDAQMRDAVAAAIREADKAGDTEKLAYWSWRLDEAATRWRAWRARVRAAEAAIRADLAEKARAV